MLNNNLENDTIAAVATATGKNGVAIVRMSGPESVAIIRRVFSGSKDPGSNNRVMLYGHIIDKDETIDEVLVCAMLSPHSYTGEDIVEVQCHGGYAAAETILGVLIDNGARSAEPGEFTKRAFLSGRIDLVQAESVMEIVSAEGREHLRKAERLMDGTFSSRIETLLDDLTLSNSLLELNIDFLHQGLQAIKKDDLVASIKKIAETLDSMIVSYTAAKRIKDGIQVVLTGRVNAGKSSLFNALLGRKRAIVNEIPGTTRDWLEDKINLDSIPINLIDTAGLRETEDTIEKEGVLESERLLDDADLLVYLVDGAGHCTETAHYFDNRDNVIRVISKCDLLSVEHKQDAGIFVSTLTGNGINDLRDIISSKARALLRENTGDTIVLVERHTKELQEARDALGRALDSIPEWSEEVTAFELQQAQGHIEAVLGRNVDIDILDSIFQNFCIGK